MSRAEIIKSLEHILDEINETPEDSFIDVECIKESIEDIITKI